MKTNLTLLLLVLFVALGNCASYLSVQSGLFSDTNTWSVNITRPDTNASGDTWKIAAGHTVIYDVDNSAQATGWGLTTNEGNLLITNKSYYKANAIHYGLVGSTWTNCAPDRTMMLAQANGLPTFVLEFITAGSISHIGTNTIFWNGDTNNFFDYTSNLTSVGAAIFDDRIFFTNNVANVVSNDFIMIANPAVLGLGGTCHQVYGVWTNCIVLFTNSWNEATNTMSAHIITGQINTNHRTNVAVVKISRPIVVVHKTRIANTGVFSATTAKTNTIKGTRFTNGGLALFASGNGNTAVSCSGTMNGTCGIGSGSLSGYVAIDCVGVGNVSGGIWNLGSYHQSLNCIGISNGVAGIVNAGTRMNMIGCKAFNNTGGLATTGIGSTMLNCYAVANSISGIWNGSATGYGIIISNCVGVGNAGGNIATAGSEVLIQNCQGYRGQLAGIAYNGTAYTIIDSVGVSSNLFADIGHTLGDSVIINCTNQNTNMLYRCSSTKVIGNVGNVVLPLADTLRPADCVSLNFTNFIGTTGVAECTTNGYVNFWPSNSLSIPAGSLTSVPYYVSLAPKSQVNPVVWLYLTNGVSYEVATAYGTYPSATSAVFTNAAMGWTNISYAFTNRTVPSTFPQSLWVVCSSSTNPVPAGTGQRGYARVVVPTEYQTRVIP